MTQQSLSDWEQRQATNARHRTMIRQILARHPEGLTVQQIIRQELETYGYFFLTDNRLREDRALKLVECFGKNPQRWRLHKE